MMFTRVNYDYGYVRWRSTWIEIIMQFVMPGLATKESDDGKPERGGGTATWR